MAESGADTPGFALSAAKVAPAAAKRINGSKAPLRTLLMATTYSSFRTVSVRPRLKYRREMSYKTACGAYRWGPDATRRLLKCLLWDPFRHRPSAVPSPNLPALAPIPGTWKSLSYGPRKFP